MNLLSVINEKVGAAFKTAGYQDAQTLVRAADRPDLADYQANGALALAKSQHQNPREVAEKIAEELKKDSFFSEVSVAGPGFINMKIKDEELTKLAAPILTQEKAGYERVDKPRTVVLDYCGPNVGKVMHVGHLRSGNIGDAVRRIMTFAGDKTIGDAHLGDWGRPMGLVLTELQKRWPDMPYFKADYKDDKGYQVPFTLADVIEAYPVASAKAKEDEAYMEQAKNYTRELQEGNKGLRDLWKKFVDLTKADTQDLMQQLNVHLDLWWGESTVNDRCNEMIERLKKSGVAELDDGAWIIRQEGDTPPLILVNSAGASMYAATDLATLEARMEEFKPDVVLYFTDARQSLHFAQVFATAKKTGIVPENVKLEYQPFGSVNGADNKPYKTRDGGVPTLRFLIDSAVQKARAKMESGEIGRDLTDAEKDEISHTVGVAALKFMDLMNDKVKNYIFDEDRMLATEGKTGPYLLYAMVRMKSVLEKLGKPKDDTLTITNPAERKLLLNLYTFPENVQIAYDNRAPHVIADYLYKLCQDFNLFYHDCSIKDADESTKNSRLNLLAYTLKVALLCADMLGLKVPNKM
ncbi:MAG: arginine--tRNA ligase [Alphaproteobacteria bacterium]|nr:arginine--tRNA ligase [Alphaproteobacteria bacterium]